MDLTLDQLMMNADGIRRDYSKLTSDFIKSTTMDNWIPAVERIRDYLDVKAEEPLPAEWHTANEVVYEGHKVALRKFNSDKRGNPLIVVAPEAGGDSLIVDYGPKQSLVECALAVYPGDVYAVHKLPATGEHTEYTIDDSIRSLKACVDHIGEPVNIIGFCQGGWQSAVYTALFPEDVKSLTVAAGPIDFHAGDAQIAKMTFSIPFSFYEWMVSVGNGNMPGSFIRHGFMMMNAVDRFLGDDLALYNNLENTDFVDRQHQFQSWYQRYQPVPGKMYLQIVKNLFNQNKLIKGELEVLGQKVRLKNITQQLVLVGGTKDDITPVDQVMALKKYAKSKNVSEIVVPAGHIGVFMSKSVIKNFWPSILKVLGTGQSVELMRDNSIGKIVPSELPVDNR
jgi:poly(3-hydroxyalkanoate) synthetase